MSAISVEPQAHPVARSSEQLGARFDAARRRLAAHRLLVIVSLLSSAVMILIGTAAVADYLWMMGRPARLGWLVFVGLAMIATTCFLTRWARSLSNAALAAHIEQQHPELGQRLRTALDYTRAPARSAPANPALVRALQQQTEQLTHAAHFDELSERSKALAALGMAVAIVTCALLMLGVSPEARIAAGRALLLPWEYTTVTVTPLAVTVYQGEDVIITADVAGRPVHSALVRYRAEGTKDWTTLQLQPVTDGSAEVPQAAKLDESSSEASLVGELQATLSDCQANLEFQVVAGPRPLPPGHITVRAPLLLDSFRALMTPPAYTGADKQPFDTPEFRVLEGSKVELTFTLNRAPAEAQLSIVSEADIQAATGSTPEPRSTLPLSLEGPAVRATLNDVRRAQVLELTARTNDEVELAPLRLQIDVQLDGPPSVKFLEPPEELEVTPTTEIKMALEAADDYGLMKAGVAYQIGDGPLHTLWEQAYEAQREPITAAPLLALEEHKTSYQEAVTYYAFAEDHYFGTTRRTTTPLRFIDIRPYKRAFQMCEGGSCNGISLTLEELIARQRQNLALTFAAAELPAVPPPTRERILRNERELMAATREFAEGLAARGGKVEPLEEAVSAMELATSYLTVGTFPAATAEEQAALNALVRARRNLRQRLSQSSSSSACRKFDRQQRQKLRTPEQHKQAQEQQLAEARNQLNDLAKRQRLWSEEVQSTGSKSEAHQQQAQAEQQEQKQQQPSQQAQSQQAQSQGAAASASSNSSGSSVPPGNRDTSSKQAEQLAASQQQLIAEQSALAQRLKALETGSTQTAPQLEAIAEEMQRALEAIERPHAATAAEAGRAASARLDQLADHLAQMTSTDFGERLAHAQQQADQLARDQQALDQQLAENSTDKATIPSASERERGSEAAGPESLAPRQEQLADQTTLLAELLAQLRAAALEQSVTLRSGLEQLETARPAGDIAAGMQRAARELAAGRPEAAARDAHSAARDLERVATTLRQLRGEFAQPQLDELMQLEQQLAQLIERIDRARSAAEGDAAAAAFERASAALEALAARDEQLAEALENLRAASPSRTANSPSASAPPSAADGTPDGQGLQHEPHGNRDIAPGFYSRDRLLQGQGLRQLNEIVQTRIQEAILSAALLDPDDEVPPEFKDIVEQYYRALSDDLR